MSGKYFLCVMPEAVNGLGIVSENFYEKSKFKCTVFQSGTFKEVLSYKKKQTK